MQDVQKFFMERYRDALPIVLHADHGPAAPLRFVVESLGKCSDLGVGQSRSWAVSIFARRVVVEDKHFECAPSPAAVYSSIWRSPVESPNAACGRWPIMK